MRRTTRKYSGPALERYLRRFFAAEPGLPHETAARLTLRGSATFSSVRTRANVVSSAVGQTTPASAASAPPAPSAAPRQQPITNASPAAFDAYAIGLVPTFQREGRDGLIAKLAAVAGIDDLRTMARTQQIVLPEALRHGDVPSDALRAAIADAVARRVADRKAAAG